MARPVTMATCHPDRRSKGRGLCGACYAREWYAAHPEAARRPKRRSDSTCHPGKPMRAFGLCGACYDRQPDRSAKKSVQRRRNSLKALYGLTEAEYNDMIAAQGGGCAICGTMPKRLHVDHDHASGAVRGLLCLNCNRALGLLHDDPTRLDRAAVYLRGAA